MSPIFGVKIYFSLSVKAEKRMSNWDKLIIFARGTGQNSNLLKLAVEISMASTGIQHYFTKKTGVQFHSVKDIENS